jgi:lipopolysaccharide transport system ATP-binding protein
LQSIAQLCNQVFLLEKGSLKAKDSFDVITSTYLSPQKNSYFLNVENQHKKIYFKSIQLLNNENEEKGSISYDESLFLLFKFGFNIDKKKHSYTLFVMFMDKFNNPIFASESFVIREETLRLKVDPHTFVRGTYHIKTFIHLANIEQIDSLEQVCSFEVIDNGSRFKKHGSYEYGSVFINTHWI